MKNERGGLTISWRELAVSAWLASLALFIADTANATGGQIGLLGLASVLMAILAATTTSLWRSSVAKQSEARVAELLIDRIPQQNGHRPTPVR